MTRPVLTRLLIAAAAATGLAGPVHAGTIQTLRFDLTTLPLAIFNLEFVQDFLMPAEPFDVVSSRINLNFNTETSFGTFDAAHFGLLLNPPVVDPASPSGLAFEIFSGADMGWSGAGQFTYFEEFDRLNGPSVIPPPDSGGLLYAIQYFNSTRLTDPGSFEPMGGQLTDSWVEIDFMIVPAPAAAGPLLALGALALRRRRTA